MYKLVFCLKLLTKIYVTVTLSWHDSTCVIGLAYTIDNKVGNCSVAPLTNATFDVTFGHTAGYVVKMKSPIDLFYLNGTYRYAGQVSK